MIERTYRELVSGRWRGPVAAALRGGLAALEQPYRWAVGRRNLRFDQVPDQVHSVPAPVISIGNLTVGGTGKSPLVAWLAKWYRARGVGITIISRGYKSAGGHPNDEARELATRLPGVPQLQNRDRVAAALAAVAADPRQILLLDDAFQHRRLARDLDIVLLDALAPFGYERLLPRGLLREPVEGLARAHVVALSRSDAISEEAREAIRLRVEKIAPRALWLELRHRPTGLTSSSGQQAPLTDFAGQAVTAFCGIGNPPGFQHTLKAAGLTVEGWRELPDHCAYGPAIITDLDNWVANEPAAHVICTRKDLVKIERDWLGGKRLWALDIELEITRGGPALEVLLAGLARQFHSA